MHSATNHSIVTQLLNGHGYGCCFSPKASRFLLRMRFLTEQNFTSNLCLASADLLYGMHRICSLCDVFTGNLNRSCSCMAVQWLAQSSLCAVCMFSQCLRGLSTGCPVSSHRSESGTSDWLEAVRECYVFCGGLVTCPE